MFEILRHLPYDFENLQILIVYKVQSNILSFYFQTPSGTVEYSIATISYTPPNGFAQFVVSQTEGSIYISQPLTREGVPNRFEVTIFVYTLFIYSLAGFFPFGAFNSEHAYHSIGGLILKICNSLVT